MAHIAVVGGGINGVMTAWELALRGHRVTLFESSSLMSATSSASSKLLHGGLRYLENGEFKLVKKALADRAWWIKAAGNQNLAHTLPIVWPLYKGGRRGRWLMKLGFMIYDALADSTNLGRHRWIPTRALQENPDGLRTEGLLGGYLYFDGQMDDYQLGLWACEQARQAGVAVVENCAVEHLAKDGVLQAAGLTQSFDLVVNAAGPFAEALLDSNDIHHDTKLDLVRGSHLCLDRPLTQGYLLEAPGQRRVVFVLPYQGKTLIGTTEVRQSRHEPVTCSEDEEDYLLALYNHYFQRKAARSDVVARFAGIRPLVHSADDPNRAQRDYRLETYGRVLSIFGGKWTTAPSLAREVATLAERFLEA